MSTVLNQNLLGNLSFSVLLFLMVLHAFQAVFLSRALQSVRTFGFVLANTSLLILLLCRWVETGHYPLSNLYESLMFLSWILTAIPLLVLFDTGNSGFPQPQTPLFSISGKSSKVDPKLERVVKSTKTLNVDQGTFVTSNRNFFMSSTTCVLALLVNGFATFTLPVELQKESALVPSLQSNWLIMHVTVMMASYATLMVGSLLAFFVLLTSDPNHKEASVKETIVMEILNLVNRGKQLLRVTTNKNGERYATLANNRTQSGLPNLPQTISAEKNLLSSTEQLKLILPSQMLYKDDSFSIQENSFGFEIKASEKLPLTKASWPEDLHFATDDKSISVSRAEVLDSLSYRTLGVGFPLLTIGILSGAVWANQAWGSYWSWDPKETWAFITWLVFAIYFHTRLSKGWTGKQSAFVACIGFVTVWVCYLGVNLLGKGLHSYGWWSNGNIL